MCIYAEECTRNNSLSVLLCGLCEEIWEDCVELAVMSCLWLFAKYCSIVQEIPWMFWGCVNYDDDFGLPFISLENFVACHIEVSDYIKYVKSTRHLMLTEIKDFFLFFCMKQIIHKGNGLIGWIALFLPILWRSVI